MKLVRPLAATVAWLALGMAPATRANAQVHIGASGGISFPVGNFSDGVSSGYILNGLIEGTPSDFPIGLRGEVFYSGYGFKGATSGISKIAGVVGNLVFNIDTPKSGPYVIGGVGMYHSSASVTGTSISSNDFGLNGGAGYRFALGGLSTFVEGRFHFVSTSGNSTTFLPVVFGIVF